MKRILSIICLALAMTALVFSRPVLAADLDNGAKVFGANCAACHMGGKNMVNPAKTLQKADLEANAMASLEAIKTQVANGKAAMPSFSAKLSSAEIEDVASYVLNQAEKGW